MSVTRALIENPGKVTLNLVPRALLGLFALLCGNAYIVGINQIYDVKIDEVCAGLSEAHIVFTISACILKLCILSRHNSHCLCMT